MSKIEVKNITKVYGNKKVLDNVSFTLEEGKIYGLLGRNGAGKTTILNLITNREILEDGEIIIGGKKSKDNDSILNKIYFMAEKNYFPEEMKIKDVYKWTKEFYPNFNMEYALELSKLFELDIKKKTKNMSTGYRSISKVIVAFASGAEVLFLDEPILGLDAHHRELFYKELLKLYDDGEKTIVISTHIIEEVSNMLERVIIIQNGKLKENDEVENILQKSYAVTGKGELIDRFSKGKNVIGEENIGGFKQVIIYEKKNREVINQAKELGIEISKVDLQKLFIYLTNGGRK